MVDNSAVPKDSPLVSVLMITYNQEDYIAEAIESILQQICNFQYEIVIGEDYSTDSTRRIVEEYVERYPNKTRLITSEFNIGMVPNFLRTINACKGKYVAICEGDDYWTDPYKLQKQVDFLENNKKFVLVHTNYNHYHTETGILIEHANNKHNIFYKKYNKVDYVAKELFIDILHGNYFIKTCTSMFVSQKLKQIFENDSEFIRRKFLMGDTFIFCELSQQGLVHYMPEVTAVANKLRVSAKNNPDPYKRIIFSKSLSELALYLLKKHIFINEYNVGIKRHINFILENALRYNQKSWIDDIIYQYKKEIKLKHKAIVFVARNNTCRRLLVIIRDIFINLPHKIFRKAKEHCFPDSSSRNN